MTVEQFLRSVGAAHPALLHACQHGTDGQEPGRVDGGAPAQLLEKQVTLLREDTERQVQQFADAAKATRAKLAELKTSL